MFDIFANLSEVLGGTLFVLWAPIGSHVGQLALRTTGRRVRRTAVLILMHIGVGTIFLAGQLFAAIMLWQIDWNFASNRIVLAIPPLLLPVAAIAVLTVPRLVGLARIPRRGRHTSSSAPTTAAIRFLASDPRLVVPAQLAAAGGFCDGWVVFVDRPVPPYGGYLAVLWATMGIVACLLWWRQRARQRNLAGPGPVHRPRMWVRGVRALGGLTVVALVLAGVGAYCSTVSRLPDTLPTDRMANVDWGGGPVGPGHDLHPGGQPTATSVADLTGPEAGMPDVRFTLVAQEKTIRLGSGRTVAGWTFNGRAPGPELRMHQGDLVQITVVNHLPKTAITVHWHGLEVPNAEDGVPGITQDAILPGQHYVYRFRATQVGTFWYHSHQVTSESVVRGLFGPLVILPRVAQPTGTDLTVVAHTWWTGHGRVEAFGTADILVHRTVAAGTPVRLRLINTSDNLVADADPRVLSFTGTPARVAAIDGNELHEPGELTDLRLAMAIGGRFDVTFTMPDHPVRLTDELAPRTGLVLSPDGHGTPAPADPQGPLFDPAHYGTPAQTPFDATSHFDRSFQLILDDGPGFYDGRFMFPPTINGAVFPDTPMLMVRRGDLVKVTFIDRGHMDHPMHLHGHTVQVLSRNGEPVAGSPWWTDTLEVRPGDIDVVAFRADNPGIWMDHCHNLKHAAQGMVMHLAYAGVTSPYAVGRATVNHPN